jgi:hypothetical protein
LLSINVFGYSLEEWSYSYGGIKYDAATQIIQTSDNGYSIIGSTSSFGSGFNDFWLVKINQNGTMEWNKLYGGEKYDSAYSFLETNDGGYIIAGASNSSFTNGNDYDFLIIKTDINSEIEWYKTYGTSGNDQATKIIQTTDGGFAVLGISKINKNDKFDFLLIKIDNNGNISWQKIYGGINEEMAWSLIQTDDGGFALAGYTISYGAGHSDFWLVKTDENGTMEWNRTFGGKNDDGAYSIVQTDDGGFVLAGYSEIIIDYDCYLIKTNSNGYMEWSKNYSGNSDEYAFSIIQTKDEGYALAGYTHSSLGYNFFVVKTNKSLNIKSNLSPIALAGEDLNSYTYENISFNGEGFDFDGYITKYRWDFDGDGKYDSESNKTGNTFFKYNRAGNYTAYFEIIDNNGSKNIDSKKISISINQSTIKIKNNEDSFLILELAIFLITLFILFITLFNKKIHNKIINFFSNKIIFIFKIDKWLIFLFISFITLFIIKIIISLNFSTPQVYNDAFIYGVLARDISNGQFWILGEVAFSPVHPPAGYSYLLSPAYIIGENINLVYHGMLIINCFLSSLVIIPAYLIMIRFVNKKIAFLTSLTIALLPTILAHNYLILSENALYPVFLFSCLLSIKTFTNEKLDKKFILDSILLGISVSFLIFIKSTGLAMFGALSLIFLYKMLKNKKLSNLKYGLSFIPIIPLIGYMFFQSASYTLGYPSASYSGNLALIFSNLSNFINFLLIISNEINYFVLMSYFIFFAFTIFLILNFSKIKEKESLKIFLIYGLLSIFFLIILTDIHIFSIDFKIYTRYVSPGLPIIFMFGVIGLNLFYKIKENKNDSRINIKIYIIFIISLLFFLLLFPIEDYKLINNIDLSWIDFLLNTTLFGFKFFNLLSILITVLIIFLLFLMIREILKIKSKKSFRNFSKSINLYLLLSIIISFLIFIPSFDVEYSADKKTDFIGFNKPAQWFMENDPDANILYEESFLAFSGGGMELAEWRFLIAHLYFWIPNGHLNYINRSSLTEFLSYNNSDANVDYILSTHDLTMYYPLVKSIYMNIEANPLKKQAKVDWHIYKV